MFSARLLTKDFPGIIFMTDHDLPYNAPGALLQLVWEYLCPCPSPFQVNPGLLSVAYYPDALDPALPVMHVMFQFVTMDVCLNLCGPFLLTLVSLGTLVLFLSLIQGQVADFSCESRYYTQAILQLGFKFQVES